MSSATAAATRIFEDADAHARSSRVAEAHNQTSSPGEFWRGRKHKENDPSKLRSSSPATRAGQTPLAERHLNSPPPARRIPLQDDAARPTIHKKTRSGISLKSLVKEMSSESTSVSTSEASGENYRANKSKSSTNLTTLFKKKSRRDLKDEGPKDQENISPPFSANLDITKSPIWAQFAAQRPESQPSGSQRPLGTKKTVQEEIDLYTPRKAREYGSSQQNLDQEAPRLAERPPQRPFLEQSSSRSSIFNGDLTGGRNVGQGHRPSQRSAWLESRSPLAAKPGHLSELLETEENRPSKAFGTTGVLNGRSHQRGSSYPKPHEKDPRSLSVDEISSALESLLDARNIAPNMRDQMRALDVSMKLKLIQNQRGGSGSSTASLTSTTTEGNTKDAISNKPKGRGDEDTKGDKRSRSRPRSRAFTFAKRDDCKSPTKKQKEDESTRRINKTRPKSVDMSSTRPTSSRSLNSSTSFGGLFLGKPDTAAVPGDFIHYLREVQRPEMVEIGKMHKLRILLRNESIAWTDTFVKSGGMGEVVSLLYRIIQVEWREEHEDALLHETLLCLKGLCTTSLALQRLAEIEAELFPKLLAMLFDEERKGPSDFSTRSIIISLLFAHLSASLHTEESLLSSRARTILNYLKDPCPEDAKKPFDFIEKMHVNRPYRLWCKEVVNVTKEVFWIFLHNLNVIPILASDQKAGSFVDCHFPPPRLPHPAAPYVGGVEWEATSYLAAHLDLLNGLIASVPTREERNSIREEMRVSGWEKAMGGTMRTCKEKFYGGVHEGLKVWVKAAREDSWPVEDVRAGPPREASVSPRKGSPAKKKTDEEAPRIKLDIGTPGDDVGGDGVGKGCDGWL